MSKNIKKYNRKSTFSDKLKKYCHLAKKYDYIECTEWENGEGFDINVSSKWAGEKFISFTYGEWKLVKKLVKELDKDFDRQVTNRSDTADLGNG